MSHTLRIAFGRVAPAFRSAGRGVSVDVLLARFINERAALTTQHFQVKPQLPVWHLGGAGTLHQRDIYDAG